MGSRVPLPQTVFPEVKFKPINKKCLYVNFFDTLCESQMHIVSTFLVLPILLNSPNK